MATTKEYIEYVCEQIANVGIVRYRKMFGEYMVYINNKPIILVCDDTTYIKKLPEISSLMENASTGCPYNGAKEHYILDLDDKDLTYKVITKLEEITPVPIKKVKNNK